MLDGTPRREDDSSEQQNRARECDLRGCVSPFTPSHGAPLHEGRVLQCMQKRICTLSSTSEMSLSEYDHQENLFLVVSKSFQEADKFVQNSRTHCMKDGDHDALWLTSS